jgi:hypothetical protein
MASNMDLQSGGSANARYQNHPLGRPQTQQIGAIMDQIWVLHVNGLADVLVGPFSNMAAVIDQLTFLNGKFDELSETIVIRRGERPPPHMFALELTPEAERTLGDATPTANH